MSVPEIVSEKLEGEEPKRTVPLGGDDKLVVTPTRTLVYRAEGLLSGESVEEYSHEADRVSVSEGRRKSTIRLDHGIDGESEFTIPSSKIDGALASVLWGVLSVNEVTAEDEPIDEVFRLGELSVLITEDRIIKHIGSDVWDEEFEKYDFEEVTGLDIEEGEVSSQIIVRVDGRPQRIKIPSSDAPRVRERIERSLLDYHGFDSLTEFTRHVTPSEDDGSDDRSPADADTEDESSSSQSSISVTGADSISLHETNEESGETIDVSAELSELRDAVEQQNELLESYRDTIEQLIEELRRGR